MEDLSLKIAAFLLLRTWLHLVCQFSACVARNLPMRLARYFVPLIHFLTLLHFTLEGLRALGWRPVVPRPHIE